MRCKITLKMKYNGLLFTLVLCVLVSCSKQYEEHEEYIEEELEEEEPVQRVSTWLPEWDMESALKDVDESVEGLESIRVFGGYFNEKDEPFITENAIALYEYIDEHHRGDIDVMLTFVNDYVVEGQESVQKDNSLLHRLLKDEQSRRKHIRDIIAFTKNYKVDGIEIDYEQIDGADILHYTLFLQELYEELNKQDVTLHVVVDPNFPFDMPLPDGPSYTVMAYNVHGYHSGPGAKTTFEFLDQLLGALEQSNQQFDIAFAAGGFSWPQDERAIALTGVEAEKLIAQKNSTTKRDKHSAAQYFSYEEDGVPYEAWYADTETLQSWIDYVQHKDSTYEHFIIWRAGGLTEETVRWMNDH